MDVQASETHWVLNISTEELLEKLESAEILSISAEQVKWVPPKTEGFVPVMDAREFFWYATGEWWLEAACKHSAMLNVRYPRLVIQFDQKTNSNLQKVTHEGVHYHLRVQEVGVCEKDLLEQDYLPTNLYRAYDRVYAKAVKPL